MLCHFLHSPSFGTAFFVLKKEIGFSKMGRPAHDRAFPQAL